MMNRELVDRWCERAILGLVLSILVFGPLATGAVRTLEFLIIEGLTLMAGLLWMIRLWFAPRATLLWPPVCWLVLAFVGYAIAEYHFAPLEYVARQELIRVLVYAFLFLAGVNNLNRQEFSQIISVTLVFLAMGIAAYACYQFATNSPKVWHFTKPLNYMHRGGGTYINPNHLAGFLEMVLPIGLALALMGRIGYSLRIVLGYCCLVILVGIGVSISRGGWVATGASLLGFFFVLLFQREYRIPAAAMLLLMGVAGIIFLNQIPEVRKRFDSAFLNNTVHDARQYYWPPAVQMWQEHRWLGVGPGQYDENFRRYRAPVWQAQTRPVYTHNDYLNTLADWGAIGLGLIVAFLGLLTFGLIQTWPFIRRSSRDLASKKSNRAAFVYGASFGLLALLIHSVFDFNMQIPANAILAITLMALLTGYQRFATEKFWTAPGIFFKIGLTLLLLAGMGYLGQQAVRKVHEYQWLVEATRAQDSPNEQIAAWEKAFAAEPQNAQTAYLIGETRRLQSWEGNADYESLAHQSMQWLDQAARLDALDPYIPLRHGMCLDWVGQHDAAYPYYQKALALDPNGSYIVAHMGWHFLQVENYEEARRYFESSLRLYDNSGGRNSIAHTYLSIALEKLAEQSAKPAIPSP